MNIEAINEGWFYDDVTPRGVSFDAFLPQACKTPLGNIHDYELIHTPEEMANFQNNDWYRNNWNLADIMLTVSPLQSDKHVLVDAYRKEMAGILSCPCDYECCEHDTSCDARPTRGSCRGLRTLHEDLSRYGDVMTGNNDLDDGKFYDVKKEIYRLTDRVFAALAKCYEVEASGTFAVIDELHSRDIISVEARDNFACASAIAIKLRLSTYIKAGKQGEQIPAISENGTAKLPFVYNMSNDKELFHFFFIAIPLYEELQQFKGNMPPSLKDYSFFDDSDVTMGQVYCRLLDYNAALKCYERAARQNPDKLSIQIRHIRITLLITKNTEERDKNRQVLDCLLRKIGHQSSIQRRQNVSQAKVETTTSFVNLFDMEECRQLLEVLLFASLHYDCHKYFVLAEKILSQCLAVEERKRKLRKEVLMMKFAFMIFYMKHYFDSFVQQHQVDAVTSELASLIDEEGVSTKSLVWLNKLGEFFFIQGKIDKAYRCFQRALSMANLLYGRRPQVNMMTSLNFLGMTSWHLFMYTESKFYFESLVQLFESFGGPIATSMIKHAYLQLALLGVAMASSVEEIASYLEKGLQVTTVNRYDAELVLDCALYYQLAIARHAQNSSKQAWKAAMDGKACLESIVGENARVTMTCQLAMTLAEIKKKNEAIIMLKEQIQKLTSQSQVKQRAFCMMNLGKLCAEQSQVLDSENYYKQALKAVIERSTYLTAEKQGEQLQAIEEKGKRSNNAESILYDDIRILDIVKCLIGIAEAIKVDDGREAEAGVLLDEAYNFTKKLPASKKKCSCLVEIGELCENLSNITLARLCFDEALRSCKEESNIQKKLPFMEFNLEVKLGEMANNPSTDIPLEQRQQAQRLHYDRAAEVLRQHVATGQVDSTTVTLFLSLALKFMSVDLNEKIRLLLEALNISEMVYGANEPSEMVTTILGQLSDTSFMTGDRQAATKYGELLIRMEMKLHSSSPFHEHICRNLTMLSFLFLVTPGDIDSIERVHEFLLSAQKDKALINVASKAAAARCFASLAVLFYALDELEKAATFNEMAGHLFNELQESVERELQESIERKKLPCKSTCDLMKKVLLKVRMNPNALPSCKKEIYESVAMSFAFDSFKPAIDQKGFRRSPTIQNEKRSLQSSERNSLLMKDGNIQQDTDNGHDNEQEDSKSAENCTSGLENSNSSIPCFPGTRLEQIKPTDFEATDVLTETLSQIKFPVKLESFPDTLLSPESIKSTTNVLDQNLKKIEPTLSIIPIQYEAIEYNTRIGNIKQAATIHASLQSEMLSFYENCSFDSVSKLVSDAITEKERNNTDSAIRFLDYAFQLSSYWRRKSKILKLRGECYLSNGDSRTAAINFTMAVGLHSSRKEENDDDLCEYLEVLIGLVKSEILCQNVAAAWLTCQRGIQLVSDHDQREGTRMQATECFFYGAKCLNILSETRANKHDMLSQASSLCEQAFSLCQSIDGTRTASELMQELGSSGCGEFFALKCEVQLLLAAILLKLTRKAEAEKILKEIKEFLMNIAVVFESDSINSKAGDNFEYQKISRRLFSWIARAVVMCGEMELSATWLNKSLFAFFSGALPDMFSFYKEFLPLVEAINVFKSNSNDESHSPLEQALDMCKEAWLEHGNNLNYFYEFLKTLARLYMNLGLTNEAIVVAGICLEISDLSGCINSDRTTNRNRMLLYLAQLHQINSSNSCHDRNTELELAEKYYLMDNGLADQFSLQKNISYANFLCKEMRFAEAEAVLQHINKLDKRVLDKSVFCSYFSRVFYGSGVRESVEVDGELCLSVGDILYSTMVRVLVGMGMKKEAVAACENLTENTVVHELLIGKRPSCMPYIKKGCHRELLSLVSGEDRKELEKCDFPLCSTNLFKLYHMLGESTLALKYCPTETESPDLIEIKISCLCSAGNELVETNRGNESHSFFKLFLGMLQTKEGFLEKPFNAQCEILQRYAFANQFYVFRSLGGMLCKRGNLDGAIECYERCLDLDKDFACDQNIAPTLAELYQSKALTVDIINQHSRQRLMQHALNLFQELLRKATRLTAFAECSYASLLSKLKRYDEAVQHLESVIQRADDENFISFSNVDKPLVEVHLRREIEARGGITIPLKVQAFYELVLVDVKCNKMVKAQEVACQLENYITRFQSLPTYLLVLSVVGYAHQLTGNMEKAAEVFVSVLESFPGYLPVAEALEACCM